MSDTPRRYRYTRAHRLSGNRQFQAVYHARVCKSVGPIRVCGRPNNLGHPRLGLSVSRRVGTAVARSRIKRLLREAFRLSQYDWAAAYDIVVVVRPHEPLRLAEYQRLLFTGLRNVHRRWSRRLESGDPPTDSSPK